MRQHKAGNPLIKHKEQCAPGRALLAARKKDSKASEEERMAGSASNVMPVKENTRGQQMVREEPKYLLNVFIGSCP